MNAPVEPIVDEAKAAQRAVWELGNYAKVADTVIPDLGRVLVDACGVGPQDDVVDIACGVGNATLPAAERAASVAACDISPLLLAECSRRASSRGLTITCTPADAEALPYPDNSFGVALSCVGIMFAPDHQAAADELIATVSPSSRLNASSLRRLDSRHRAASS